MKYFYNCTARVLMILALVLVAGKAKADVKISVDPVTIAGDETVLVPVMLDNTDGIITFTMLVTLPDELEFGDDSQVSKNNDRFTNDQNFGYNLNFAPNVGKFEAYTDYEGDPIMGNSGVLFYFPVKVKEGKLADKTVQMTFSNIKFKNADYENSYQDEFNVNVTIDSRSHVYVAYPVAESVVINPGSTQTVSIAIDNTGEIYGFQMDVVLPEGLSIPKQTYNGTDRWDVSGAKLTATNNGNETTFILYSKTTGPAIYDNTKTGTVLNFNVVASEDYSAENGVISIKEFEVAYTGEGDNKVGEIKGSMNVINGKVAYNKAVAEIAALEAALAVAVDSVAKVAPDFVEQYTGAEITATIATLKEAVDAAYADYTLTPSYNDVMTPAAAVTEATAKLLEEAAAAQAAKKAAEEAEAARVAANKEAYEAVVTKIAGLQEQLDSAVVALKAYPAAKVEAEIDAVKAAIAAATTGAEAAEAAVAEQGTFEYTVDAEAVEALIAKIEEKAKADQAAQDEVDRQDNNKAAYDAVIARLDSLSLELNAAVKLVAEKYPVADVTSEKETIKEQISNARNAALAALISVTNKGVYSYEVPVIIETFLNAMVEDAANAQAAKDEADRKAANLDAHNAVLAELDNLQAEHDAVNAKYTGNGADNEKADVQAAIDRMRGEAADALYAVSDEGQYAYTVDSDHVRDLIAKFEQAIVTTGISSVFGDDFDGIKAIYTIDGRQVSEPVRGVNIIVTNSGKTKKIVIK